MFEGKSFRLRALLFLFMLPILSSCGGNAVQEVKFLADERWEAQTEIGLPVEALTFIGSTSEIEQELDELIAQMETDGVEASWTTSRDDTTIVYTVSSEGTGYALLNRYVFDDDANITVAEFEGNRQINFSYSTSRTAFSDGNYTLTLQGGEIISSNGILLDNDTVQWVNPSGRLEATLTESSTSFFGFLLRAFGVLLLLGLLGGAAFAGYLWYQQRQKSGQTVFCPHCGTAMVSQAKFCPSCGKPRGA